MNKIYFCYMDYILDIWISIHFQFGFSFFSFRDTWTIHINHGIQIQTEQSFLFASFLFWINVPISPWLLFRIYITKKKTRFIYVFVGVYTRDPEKYIREVDINSWKDDTFSNCCVVFQWRPWGWNMWLC